MNLTPRIDRLDQNYIMNSPFLNWQRGTSINQVGNGGFYGADRFKITTANYAGTLDVTVSRSTDVPTIAQSNHAFLYSHLVTVNVAEGSTPATAYTLISQRIEPLVFADLVNEDMTISFWVKASVAGDYTFHINLPSGTPYQFYKTRFTINSTGTWQKIFFKIPKMDQPSLLFSASYVEFVIQLANGSTNTGDTGNDDWVTDHGGTWAVSSHVNLTETTSATLNLTGFKVGIDNGGSTDQEFSLYNGSVDSDLRACQRYYTVNAYYDIAHYLSVNQLHCNVQYKVSMRATPTVTLFYSTTNGVVRSLNDGSLKTSSVAALSNEKGFGRIDSAGLFVSTHLYHFGYKSDAEL